jgi:hypothetical protein
VRTQLESRYGIHAVVVPEAATIVLQGALIDWNEFEERDSRRDLLRIQRSITQLQQQLRLTFLRLASEFGSRRPLVLFDRAELDGFAYIDWQEFQKLLAALGMSVDTITASYDAVVHMRPAPASPAQSTVIGRRLAPNLPRTLELDARIERAWQGHPTRVFISQADRWEVKRERLLEAILTLM